MLSEDILGIANSIVGVPLMAFWKRVLQLHYYSRLWNQMVKEIPIKYSVLSVVFLIETVQE